MIATLRGLFLLVLIQAGLLFIPQYHAAAQSKRAALVIGNAHYTHSPDVKAAANDAKLMAKRLKDDGYDVTLLSNVGLASFQNQLKTFGNMLLKADVGLFYYSGHSFQLDGENMLVPVDATLSKVSEADFETLSLQIIMRFMQQKVKKSIILIDAGRSFTTDACIKLAQKAKKNQCGFESGFTQSNVTEEGLFIAFSSAPGYVAGNGDVEISPFTAALGDSFDPPEQEINDLMSKVRGQVFKATQGQQIPWAISSMLDPVVLAAGGSREDKARKALQEMEALAAEKLAKAKLESERKISALANEKDKTEAELKALADEKNAIQKQAQALATENKIVSQTAEKLAAEKQAALEQAKKLETEKAQANKIAEQLAAEKAALEAKTKALEEEKKKLEQQKVNAEKQAKELASAKEASEKKAAELVLARLKAEAKALKMEKQAKLAQQKADEKSNIAISNDAQEAVEALRREAEAAKAKRLAKFKTEETQPADQTIENEADRPVQQPSIANPTQTQLNQDQEEEIKTAKLEENSLQDRPVLTGAALALAIQSNLRRLGCSPGKVDGKWGRNSARALREFGKHADVQPASSKPSQALLDQLHGLAADQPVCPIGCGPGQVERGGVCTALPSKVKNAVIKRRAKVRARINRRHQNSKRFLRNLARGPKKLFGR